VSPSFPTFSALNASRRLAVLLVNLSFALNYAISGTALLGYHVVNLAIHAVARERLQLARSTC
jgi:hypothetical protein